MSRVKLFAWLPIYSLLDPQAEQLFRAAKTSDARDNSTLFCVLTAAMLLLFNLTNHIGGIGPSEPENVLRYIGMLVMAIPLLLSPRVSDRLLQPLWLTVALVLIGLICCVFYLVGQRLGRLSEGGPLVVIMAVGTLSFFHLGQKLILWCSQLVGMFAIFLFTDVTIHWTLFYCVLAVAMFCLIQYRLDVLQRQHFRFELAERQKAETDKLTGALNRHSFEQRLSGLLARLQPGQTLCLAMLDIDHFKRYNDHYGHLEGDACLVAVSRALKALPLDLLVRFGGEEFIVVAVVDAAVPDYLLHLQDSISALQIPHVDSPLGHVTTSVGLCTYRALAGGDLPGSHELLAAADALLYQAKEQGRNCLCSAPL